MPSLKCRYLHFSLLSALAAMLALLPHAHAHGSLDDFILAELEASNLTGVSYAILRDEEITIGTHGVSNLQTHTPLSPDTPFMIGSISKSFTAMAVLQLVEAGQVELNGEIAQYLDAFIGKPSADITVRQLLGHKSGYSTLQGNDPEIGKSGARGQLSDQVARFADTAPAHPIGQKWDYSNANYILLGAIIEAVSGMTYKDYVEANILAPIGMSKSFVSDGGQYEIMATGHTPWFGGKRTTTNETSSITAPAGGIVATAGDLALYVSLLINGRDDIIIRENKALMMQPASAQFPYYGLGWMLSPEDGLVYHTGTSPGIDTLAIFDPDQKRAAIILVNSGSGLGFGETSNLINGISAHAFEKEFVPNRNSWGRKSLFLMYATLPFLFLIGTVQAWFGRAGLRQKSGISGALSLWFPMLIVMALAWISVVLIPNLFGVSLGSLSVFSPDFALILAATAATGILWGLSRLVLHYVKPIRKASLL